MYSAETFDQYVSRARAIALQTGYEVIDLYTIIKASRRDYLAPDGLHFNSQGHAVIADLVTAALAQTRPAPARGAPDRSRIRDE